MITWPIEDQSFPEPPTDYETIMRRINDAVFRVKLVQARTHLRRAHDVAASSQVKWANTLDQNVSTH